MTQIFLVNYKEITGKLPGNTYIIHTHYSRKVLMNISFTFPWNDTIGTSYNYLCCSLNFLLMSIIFALYNLSDVLLVAVIYAVHNSLDFLLMSIVFCCQYEVIVTLVFLNSKILCYSQHT